MPIKNSYLFKHNFSSIARKLEAIFFVYAMTIMLFMIMIPKNNNPAVITADKPVMQNKETPAPEPQKPPDEKFKYLGWWGDIAYDKTGVFAEPDTKSKKLGAFTKINRVKVLEEVAGETIGSSNTWYKIDGGMYPGAYVFSADVTSIDEPAPPAIPKIPANIKEGDYWIDIDLNKKILSLFLYDKPIFATYVATGVSGHLTPSGVYRIWYKIEKTRMQGRPPTAARIYDLPNVPYAMFYRGSYSLHGTYWHDKFGTRQSSGCTNLTQGDAKFIFDRVSPLIAPATAKYAFSKPDNPGTIIYNHY